MDPKDEIIKRQEETIKRQEAQIQDLLNMLKEQNDAMRVTQASLDKAMGKTETNESVLGGQTPDEILMQDAIKEDNERSFR